MSDITQITPPKRRKPRPPNPLSKKTTTLHLALLHNAALAGDRGASEVLVRLGRESQREARRAAQARERERNRRAKIKAAKEGAAAQN
jgi:hypothetical protein